MKTRALTIIMILLLIIMQLGGNSVIAEHELEERNLVIAMAISGRDEDAVLVDAEMSRIAKERLNVNISTLYIPMASWTQQANLMLASGEQIDIMMSGSIHGFSTNVGKGQFLPLNNLLEKYGQDILSSLNKKVLDCGTVNGKIFGVASLRDLATAPCILFRKDIIEKHNIDLSTVKTFEDLTPVFEAIKQAEPEMTTLVAKFTDRSIVEWMTRGLLDELGCVSNHYGTLPIDPKGDYTLTSYYETQTYQDCVALVREWYNSGYISSDAATTTDIGYNTVKAGKAVSYFMAYKPGVETQESRFCGTDMICIQLAEATQSSDQVTGYLTVIPVTTIDAERAMMLLNLFYSNAELETLWINGIEGTHYDFTDDTRTVIFSDDNHSKSFASINYMLGNSFLTPVWKGESIDLWKEMKVFNDTAKQSSTMGFTFNTEPVATEVAVVANVRSEYARGVGCGVLDPNIFYPEFIAKLKASGYHAIIEEEQRQLNAWLEANNK